MSFVNVIDGKFQNKGVAEVPILPKKGSAGTFYK